MHFHFRKLGKYGREVREKNQPQTQYTKTNSLGFLRFLTKSVGWKER